MTYKEKLNYLKQYRTIISNIKSKHNQLDEITCLSAQRYDTVGHSSTVGSPTETTAIRIEELTKEIDDSIAELQKVRHDIEKKIRTVKMLKYRFYLEERFITGKSASRIAFEQDKDEKAVYAAIRRAILMIDWE